MSFEANQAIVRCGMCDLNGYRPNGFVCDHIDHRPAYERGMAAVREVLEQSRKNSVRSTMDARRDAFNRQQLVEQQRQAGPPLPFPEEPNA